MKNMQAIGVGKQSFATTLGLCALLMTGAAQAVPLTWDADTGTTGAKDGGGTWETGVGGWWDAAGSSNANWVASDTATFGAATDGTYAITVGSDIAIGGGASGATTAGLSFNNTGYTLSAAAVRSMTIGSGTVAAYMIVAAEKAGIIGDKVAFAKGGTGGTLYLGGGGTLRIDSGGSYGSGSSTTAGQVAGNATLHINGGTVSWAGSLSFGRLTSGTAPHGISGHLVIDSGILNVGTNSALGNLALARNGSDNTSITINGGTITVANNLTYGQSGIGNGVVHLNGGAITVKRVYEAAGTPVSTFNFNGGMLIAQIDANATFMYGLDTVQLRNGGAKIDSNGQNITVAQNLLHSGIGGDDAIDGGLTKIGTGTLTLTTNNTYSGTTTVSNGTLLVNNATGSGTGSGSVVVTNATLGGVGFISGAVTLQANSTLAPGTNTVAGGILTCAGGLTLAAGVTNAFDCTASTCDSVAVTGALAIQGANTVALTFTGGTVPYRVTLFTFTSVTGGEHLDSWTVTGMPGWQRPRVRVINNTLVAEVEVGTTVSFF